MAPNEVTERWYKVTNPQGNIEVRMMLYPDHESAVNFRQTYIEKGFAISFEPAVVLTQAEYDVLLAQPATPAIPSEVYKTISSILADYGSKVEENSMWALLHPEAAIAAHKRIDAALAWLEAQKEETGGTNHNVHD